MTKEEADFIGSMNMCDEISNEAYKKIMCYCAEQEPCEDAVSREAVLDKAYAYGYGLEPEGYCVDVADIQSLPSVTPKKKTGHWIMTGDYYTGAYGSIDYVKCSCCGEDSLEEGNYCPNCGAEMKSEE